MVFMCEPLQIIIFSEKGQFASAREKMKALRTKSIINLQ